MREYKPKKPPTRAFWDPTSAREYYQEWHLDATDSRDVLIRRPNGKVYCLEDVLRAIEDLELAMVDYQLLGSPDDKR